MEEFDCKDCGAHVFSWPLGYEEPRVRCYVCQWIHDQPNLTKEQIEEIRTMTATPILEKDDGLL